MLSMEDKYRHSLLTRGLYEWGRALSQQEKWKPPAILHRVAKNPRLLQMLIEWKHGLFLKHPFQREREKESKTFICYCYVSLVSNWLENLSIGSNQKLILKTKPVNNAAQLTRIVHIHTQPLQSLCNRLPTDFILQQAMVSLAPGTWGPFPLTAVVLSCKQDLFSLLTNPTGCLNTSQLSLLLNWNEPAELTTMNQQNQLQWTSRIN